jgi:hypothetical protein
MREDAPILDKGAPIVVFSCFYVSHFNACDQSSHEVSGLVDADFDSDISCNSFQQSPHGQKLQSINHNAWANAGADFTLIVDIGADGVQLYKFKHHSASVYAIR